MTPLSLYLIAGLIAGLAVALARIPACLASDRPARELVSAIASSLIALIGWPLVVIAVVYVALYRLRKLRCGYCQAAFAPSDEEGIRAHVLGCDQNPLVQMVATQQGQIENLAEALGAAWGLIYADGNSWEYPSQVPAHLRVELDRRANAARALAAALEEVIDRFVLKAAEYKAKYPQHADLTPDEWIDHLRKALRHYREVQP